MKKKKTPINGDNKKRFQPHFRKAYNGKFTGHPQYIYADDEKMYKIIGITSSPKTNGVDNIPLECNPEPKNKKKKLMSVLNPIKRIKVHLAKD